ncbi:MAG: ABC transporter permease [Armatimonadetes bacterium]|nr:ABC transporter permease [Armatimonadota bacterium]
MRLLALIGKELRTFLRDPALVFVVVFVFLVHPYQSAAEVMFALNNYPVATYDLDRTPQSQAFLDKLRAPYFSVRRRVQREREIDEELESDRASMVVVIPEGFARRLHRGQPAAVQVLSDGTYSPTSQRAGNYVAAIAQEFALEQQHGALDHATLPVVDARLRIRYNPALEAAWPQSLDMVFMAVTLISMLLPAAFMVREKEQGTIEQLLVSPLRPWEITASKLLPMILVATVATVGSLGVLGWAFGLPVRGSRTLFIVATALTVFSMGGLGLVIATVTRTLPGAMILAFMLIIPIQFLSGSITPVETMPAWQYYLTLLSPQRYYLNIGYGIVLKGASLGTLWRDFVGLILVGGGLFLLGARRFQRQFG